jgi:hypothetical protein
MFADLIDEHGQPDIAEVCDVLPVTVRTWRHKNRIPRSKWHLLLKAYRREGLTFDRLVAMETASQQVA